MADLQLDPNIDYSKIILSDAQRAEVARYVDDEVRRLARFTLDAEADKLPEGLLNGIPREVWRTMTPREACDCLAGEQSQAPHCSGRVPPRQASGQRRPEDHFGAPVRSVTTCSCATARHPHAAEPVPCRRRSDPGG